MKTVRLVRQYSFIPKEQIEKQANDVLQTMREEKKEPVWPFDATLVADFFRLGVSFEPFKADENDIAARILPLKRQVHINTNLKGSEGPFGESTVSHEVGHWVLHIDKEALKLVEVEEACPEKAVLVCKQVDSAQRSMEFQAQYFASCLMMPRIILMEFLRNRDLTNWQHRRAMAHELGVSQANLCSRLKDLQWLRQTPMGNTWYAGSAAPWRISS